VLIRLAIIIAAGTGGLMAGYVLWWCAQRGGLWNMALGVLLGLAAIILAVLIAFVMVRSTNPF